MNDKSIMPTLDLAHNLIAEIIDASKASALWDKACATRWNKAPIWIHGDFAIGNILLSSRHCEPQSGEAIQKNDTRSPRLLTKARDDGNSYKLSAVIDFGGAAAGDPACDLVIAWTYLFGKAREIFIAEMDMDQDTWLRARAWALWKATFELCQIADKNSSEALLQKQIIAEAIDDGIGAL